MQIPTMAFDHVNIEENSSDLNQYALLKQLALVPIRVDPKFFEFAGLPSKQRHVYFLFF